MLPYLFSAEGEVRDINDIAAAASMQWMTLKLLTASTVLTQLPVHNLVHFTCHEVSDPNNPYDRHQVDCTPDFTHSCSGSWPSILVSVLDSRAS